MRTVECKPTVLEQPVAQAPGTAESAGKEKVETPPSDLAADAIEGHLADEEICPVHGEA